MTGGVGSPGAGINRTVARDTTTPVRPTPERARAHTPTSLVNGYVVDLRTNFDATLAACKRYFGEHRPAMNVLGVEALAFPPQLIEIGATVVLASDSPSRV